jgi:hypothetical protein
MANGCLLCLKRSIVSSRPPSEKAKNPVAELARGYLAGELSAKEVLSLNDRLKNDRDARREFARALLEQVELMRTNDPGTRV